MSNLWRQKSSFGKKVSHERENQRTENCRDSPLKSFWYLNDFFTAWKVSKYGVFSGPYFRPFGLKREIYSLNLGIQSECGKNGPEKTRYLDTFHAIFIIEYLHWVLKQLCCNQFLPTSQFAAVNFSIKWSTIYKMISL